MYILEKKNKKHGGERMKRNMKQLQEKMRKLQAQMRETEKAFYIATAKEIEKALTDDSCTIETIKKIFEQKKK